MSQYHHEQGLLKMERILLSVRMNASGYADVMIIYDVFDVI